MSMEVARAKVAEGVKLLDANVPNWRDKVDADTLDMASSTHCVLGQTHYNNYFAGKTALGITNGSPYGFSLSTNDYDCNYSELDQAWREVLNQNRSTEPKTLTDWTVSVSNNSVVMTNGDVRITIPDETPIDYLVRLSEVN